LVLRPWLEWVSGATRRPRGGSLLADLQANAISVGANVALFWDRPSSQVIRSQGFFVTYAAGVTLTDAELLQQMSVSLLGGAAQASSALRLTVANGIEPIGFSFNSAHAYFSDNSVVLMASRHPQGFDRTQLYSRRLISLNGSTRLVQPLVGSNVNSIEILTASPDGGGIVATAKPQENPEPPLFGLAAPLPPTLIWPEELWKPLFSKNPLAGLGGSAYRAVIYRDGELVATADRTPPATPSDWTAPFAEHTDEDGSYLLQFDSNAGQLKGFLSFVIDRTPPMGCFEQVNDFFEGDPTNASGFAYTGGIGLVRRFTTEPTRTLADSWEKWESGSSEFSRNVEAGSHTLEYPGSFFDEVGNPMPTPLPTAQFRVHEIPDGGKYGAQAALTLPPNGNSLVYDSPVPSILVTFNRQVVGLREGMFTVEGKNADGDEIGLPFTLSGQGGEIAGSTEGSGTTFTLTLDTDPEKQSYNTSWLVVFDPRSGGQVFADAGNEPPEPCALRSRCAWLIRQDPSVGRTPIDTSSSVATLDRVPTVTATLTEAALPPLPDRNDSLIDLSADVVLPVAAIPLDVPPMGCYEQVNDFFYGDPTNASGLAWNQEGFAQIARVESERTTPDPIGDYTPPAWPGTSDVSRSLPDAEAPYTIANPGTFRDDEGMAMPGPPTAQFRVHEIPEGGKFGAHAWISLEGDSLANKGPMLRGAVDFLTITFNRAIEGLTRSMISVVGTRDNGQTVEAAFRLYQGTNSGPELVDDDEGLGGTFTLVLDQPTQQVPNSRWLVTLAPGSRLKVPATGGSPEEPCRLVARRSWLIQQTEVPYADSSQTAWYRYGRPSPFAPQVPPSLDEATDVPYSYFGLSTTLFPSPPKALPCPAPGAAQPHSSLILGGGDITSLTVSVSGNEYFKFPMTFSASLNGESCSQNVWANVGEANYSGEFHFTQFGWTSVGLSYADNQLLYNGAPTNQVKGFAAARGLRWFVNGTTGTAVAGRSVATYSALQTATLGQLMIRIFARAYGTATVYGGGLFSGSTNARVQAAAEFWRFFDEPEKVFEWPPSIQPLTADEFGNPTSAPASGRIGVIQSGPNSATFYKRRLVTSDDKNPIMWSRLGGIQVTGPQVNGPIEFSKAGYAKTPFSNDYAEHIVAPPPPMGVNYEDRDNVVLGAYLTFTRQQEETLASGGSVQFTVGNLVYTISAS
jgi:hypothetical protein